MFVDAAREHHLDNLDRRRIGHPQAIDKARLNFKPLEHRPDLRAAAMDNHGIDAHRFQDHDIAGEGFSGALVAHRMAAVFDHEGMARKALNIRQRFRHGLGRAQQQFLGFNGLDIHG